MDMNEYYCQKIEAEIQLMCMEFRFHDDVIKWKHFPRYWPFVRGIRRTPVNSPHKGQWRGAWMLSLICAWMKCWVNNREAGDLRRYRAHYETLPYCFNVHKSNITTWVFFTELSPWPHMRSYEVYLNSENFSTSFIKFVTFPDKSGRIFYNRVPKCGSRTFMTVYKELMRLKGIRFKSSRFHTSYYLPHFPDQVNIP